MCCFEYTVQEQDLADLQLLIVFSEIIMGIEINSQHGQNMEFVKASIEQVKLIFYLPV